jgi:hypothetical protein
LRRRVGFDETKGSMGKHRAVVEHERVMRPIKEFELDGTDALDYGRGRDCKKRE